MPLVGKGLTKMSMHKTLTEPLFNDNIYDVYRTAIELQKCWK